MRPTVLLILSAIVLALFGIPNTATHAQAICPGALPSRLVVGQVARVMPGPANNVRDRAARQGALLGQVPADAVFTVLEGPVCADGFAWWRINYLYAVEGWTVEGTGSEYFLEPITPGATPTPQPTATATFTPSPTFTPSATFTATLVPTITLTPSITPSPTNIPTIDNPFHTPELGVVNRLEVGARARVAGRDSAVIVRVEPDLSAAEIIRLEPGTLVTLTGEPVESDGLRWWPVASDAGRVGWAAEGIEARGFIPNLAPLCPEEHVESARLLFYYTDPALGAPNLYTSTLDGESVCNLTYQTEADQLLGLLFNFATFSPDGSKIAITTSGVEIWEADGSGYTTILDDLLVSELAWSPDGERIAVAARLANQESQQIWAINSNGDGARVLTRENAIHRAPEWSPDGERVLYLRQAESTSDITNAVGIIGFDLSRPLLIEGVFGTASAATWSSDGEQVAVYYQDNRIDLVDAATGEVQLGVPIETETFGSAHLYWPEPGDVFWLVTTSADMGVSLQEVDIEIGTILSSTTGCQNLFYEQMPLTQDDDGAFYVAAGECLSLVEEIGEPGEVLREDATWFAVR
jgi:hypothetical protein